MVKFEQYKCEPNDHVHFEPDRKSVDYDPMTQTYRVTYEVDIPSMCTGGDFAVDPSGFRIVHDEGSFKVSTNDAEHHARLEHANRERQDRIEREAQAYEKHMQGLRDEAEFRTLTRSVKKRAVDLEMDELEAAFLIRAYPIVILISLILILL